MRRKFRTRPRLEELEPRTLLSTFYVAPTGADTAGGSLSAPWRTLQHAADTVRAGDTVIVEPGTYAGMYLSTSGTASAPVTFQAQSGVSITSPNASTNDGINLEGASYVVIDGFNVSGMPRAGIRAVTDTDVTIRNNNCDSNGEWGIFTGFSDNLDIENNVASRSQQQHGIYVSNSCVNPVIRDNQVWGNYQCGIHMNGDVSQGGAGVITGALVEGNVIHDNGAGGGSGINCDGVQNSRIQNNQLYNNHASGISLYQIDAAAGATNNVVVNNTIVLASDARWALNIQDASTGNVVFNNVLYDNNTGHGSIDISADSLPGFVSDYNVVMSRFTTNDATTVLSLAQWQANTGQDLHSVVATPSQLFVNVAGNDYHLLSTSPALDAGAAGLSGKAAPATDLAGSPRPSGAGYDIGAYELQQNVPPPPPPAPLPTASVSGPASGVRGQALAFTLSATDSNALASSTFTFNIDWDGNGTVDQTVTAPSGTAVSHVFTASGSFNARVTATDSSGAASSPASAAVSVSAAALQTDPADPTKTALVVGGTTGNDTITLSPANKTGAVSVVINGTAVGTFSPTGRIIVYGQAGDDTIKEATRKISGKVYSVAAPAFVFGGDGNDTLDFTASKGNNVLVGGTGNDVLKGGAGRDLLIGGGGSDSLYAGGQDDVLIGGTTDFDANLLALNAVMAEWGRTDVDYNTRVGHLGGSLSGGLNGGTVLNANTVHDDQALDSLYGNASVLDWFLANGSGVAPDQVSGVRSGAVVTPI